MPRKSKKYQENLLPKGRTLTIENQSGHLWRAESTALPESCVALSTQAGICRQGIANSVGNTAAKCRSWAWNLQRSYEVGILHSGNTKNIQEWQNVCVANFCQAHHGHPSPLVSLLQLCCMLFQHPGRSGHQALKKATERWPKLTQFARIPHQEVARLCPLPTSEFDAAFESGLAAKVHWSSPAAI